MATVRISKRTVDGAQPQASDAFLWDTEVKGFGLRVTPKGAKSYLLQYRMGGREAPVRRFTIGTHGSPWTPDAARQRAIDLLTDIRKGIDPQRAEQSARRENVELAFDRYATIFIEKYATREQPRSWKQADQCLRNHALPYFGSRPLPAITRREVAQLLEDVADKTPALARYLHATLRRLFKWAVSRGDLVQSPMSDMPPPSPAAVRDRVLEDLELRAVWVSAGELGFPFGSMFRLLLATGQRREEVGAMRWDEVDLGNRTWTIPATRAKNGRAQLVPLNELAVGELETLPRSESELIFSTTGSTPPSGWSKAKSRLDDIAEKSVPGAFRAPWRTHDLRRTLATGLQRLGVRFEVTEAVLNHVSGSRSGVAGIYQRHNWVDEKQVALDCWGRAVRQIVEGNAISLVPPAEVPRIGVAAVG